MPGLVEAALLLASIFVLRVFWLRKSRAALPPGPKGWPIIGNALNIPKEHAWNAFAKWGKEYGSDIVATRIFSQPTIILNTTDIATSLLDKRSAIYSDRPTLVMGGELAGWGTGCPLTSYQSPRFKELRRMFHGVIGTRGGVAKFYEVTERQMRKLLKRLLDDPDKVVEHLRWTIGSIVLEMTYGYKIQESNDSLVELVDTAVEQFSQATAPGAFAVDIIPALRYVPEWFPGAGWKKLATYWAQCHENMVNKPYEYAKARVTAGTAPPSFVSNLLEERELSPDREFIVKSAAADMHAAGTDTTVSTIHTFILAMNLNPAAQSLAQSELDALLGGERLPNLTDRTNLPYVDALVKEVFRWGPVGPLGLPHRVMEDDVYEGYHIPKGSVVIPNIWQMLHDPSVYSNPSTFDPSRFTKAKPERDPRDSCFGFGRRICPGMHLADQEVYLACANILTLFNITKAKDENGKEIVPSGEFTGGVVNYPKPFKCDIKPRSAKAEAMVRGFETV
ncbi:hypothetical protein JAAARDRAFT_193694 [Jaapia argillacea MUCL 33604]|uniref:Cytochrome P450 n=1 Tax=Jaapia argillacea MUCL 33604 TaxID=933084 RepID=A0A067PTY4_9AGAM|nr:hypothetical protein JAAARDRAFT_193694 [Jaapia argillacea MUCL 33604]